VTKRYGIYAKSHAIKHVAEIKIVHVYVPTEGGVYVTCDSRDASGLKHKLGT